MNKYLKTHLKYIINPETKLIGGIDDQFKLFARSIFIGYHHYGNFIDLHELNYSFTIKNNIVLLYSPDDILVGVYCFYLNHYSGFLFEFKTTCKKIITPSLWCKNYSYYE